MIVDQSNLPLEKVHKLDNLMPRPDVYCSNIKIKSDLDDIVNLTWEGEINGCI